MNHGVSLADIVLRGADILRQASIHGPRHEAELILGHLTGRSRAALKSSPQTAVEPGCQEQFLALCQRRALGEPLAYLTGQKEFWSLPFAVDPRVLVPRPETEHLVEDVLKRMPATAAKIVEWGTGSGCVSVALAGERPGWEIVAVERESGALQVARSNIRAHGKDARVRLLQAGSPTALAGRGWLHGLVSNPPYIPTGDLLCLEPGVRDFEPHAALDGGADGLCVIRELVTEGERLLRPGGLLALEIGSGQSEAVLELLKTPCWVEAMLLRDLAGHPRVISACRAVS